ncbi:MAG: hypothetical protein LBU64_06025 [Planctomycetota bacterium]|jgi:hypothetical protein|nr:hypothetical protein [Planctomycetota bacterium]
MIKPPAPRRLRGRFFLVFPLLPIAALVPRPVLGGAPGGEWRPLLVSRLGDVDNIDSEEGALAAFIGGMRNDGRPSSPARTLIGPAILNPTFFGLPAGAWLEAVVLAPPGPGELGLIWAFPVENRDEYTSQFSGEGLSWFDSLDDGLTVIRKMEPDGGFGEWHMAWLPGGAALFGRERTALIAARRIYAGRRAANGLLAAPAGLAADPDLSIRLDPASLASWREKDAGEYWWRENIRLLAGDLVNYWRPGSARVGLIRSLAEELALWPLSLERVDLRIWFEGGGIEWILEAIGGFAPRTFPSELESLRRVPDRTALAYAIPLGPERVREIGDWARSLLLDAAGGAVGFEAREAMFTLFSLVRRAGARQIAAAWVPPPLDRPELGAARLFVVEWERPGELEPVWPLVLQAARPESPVSRALAQIGLHLSLDPESGVPGSLAARLGSPGRPELPAYANPLLVFRRSGPWTALASGVARVDSLERSVLAGYLAELADGSVAGQGPGGPDIREAFVRMGRNGADLLGFFDPVRFLQLAFMESADWRLGAPGQGEAAAGARLAREMNEYRSGGAWNLAGEIRDGAWILNGGLSWSSLSRLAGALGLSESLGME